MPGTKMLFGDAKETCDGKLLCVTFTLWLVDLMLSTAIKRGLEARV
jgi:hypothetical protein